jgi:hypothetical protein
MYRVLFILIITTYSLFGFESQIIKFLSKTFSKNTISNVSKQYGENGLNGLKTLTNKYGKNSLLKLNEIGNKYGNRGIELLSKYGEAALKNKHTFDIVDKFGSKGFYLIKKYPNKSVNYYNKFGSKFITNADKFGNKRVIKYLDESAKYNQDGKIIKFLNKFGEKGNNFLNNHWGKLLTSGFVLLNADSLIASTENIVNNGVDKGTEVVSDSIENIANSQIGLFVGISILLFIFFKYGFEKIISLRKKKVDK